MYCNVTLGQLKDQKIFTLLAFLLHHLVSVLCVPIQHHIPPLSGWEPAPVVSFYCPALKQQWQSVGQVGNQSSGLAWFVHITDLHISQFSAEDRTRQLLQLGQLATMNHCPRNVSAHNPIITYTNSMDLYLLIPLYGGLGPAQRLHTEQVCCRAQCPLPELRQYGSCYVKPWTWTGHVRNMIETLSGWDTFYPLCCANMWSFFWIVRRD